MKKAAALIIILMLSIATVIAQTKKAPAFSLKDLKGKTVSLADFKGKVVLINFWAVWCVPCRAEIPELVKWQSKYKSDGLQILGVTYPPNNRTKIRAFIRKMKMTYPVLIGSKKTKELFDSGDTLPFSVVIDKEGNIAAQIEGVIFSDEFDEKVKPLLKSVEIDLDKTTVSKAFAYYLDYE